MAYYIIKPWYAAKTLAGDKKELKDCTSLEIVNDTYQIVGNIMSFTAYEDGLISMRIIGGYQTTKTSYSRIQAYINGTFIKEFDITTLNNDSVQNETLTYAILTVHANDSVQIRFTDLSQKYADARIAYTWFIPSSVNFADKLPLYGNVTNAPNGTWTGTSFSFKPVKDSFIFINLNGATGATKVDGHIDVNVNGNLFQKYVITGISAGTSVSEKLVTYMGLFAKANETVSFSTLFNTSIVCNNINSSYVVVAE